MQADTEARLCRDICTAAAFIGLELPDGDADADDAVLAEDDVDDVDFFLNKSTD